MSRRCCSSTNRRPGSDPQARHVVWERLFRLRQRGVTLVLTTHYMDEAEQLCDRLVVMDHGRIAAQGSPRELIDAWSTREVLELRFESRTSMPWRRSCRVYPARIEVLPDRVLLYVDNGDAALADVHQRGVEPRSALVRRSHVGGRLLAADRPDIGRLMSALQPTLASYVYWLQAYRRTWRGSATSSVLAPVLYLGALGFGLGSLVDASAGGWTGCRTSSSSRRACSLPPRCRSRRSSRRTR